MLLRSLVLATSLLALAAPRPAQSAFELLRPSSDFFFEERADGSILTADRRGTYEFADWHAYVGSSFFQEHGGRCASNRIALPLALMPQTDCNSSNTNPAAQYDPATGPEYVIPVVFHVIRRTDGTGNISNAKLQTQIDVLNEDFGAFGAGSGIDSRIQFTLAGITRTTNNTWYNDDGTYYNTLAWDPTEYLNLYTNSADGYLGYAYVPSGGGVVGNSWDRVVCYWAAIGRPGPIGSPYDLGRTATHEVGHYLGLYHTFDGGCASTSGCANNGDLICDTPPESTAHFSPCTDPATCGNPDPIHNYMDYSDDACMWEFTSNQARRMRCTLQNFRVDLPLEPAAPATSPSPANGAMDVLVTASLSWSAGSGATSHDVYFGINPSPGAGEFQGNQATTSFTPPLMDPGTTYFWRIDERNAGGTTGGSVWSFATEVFEPPDPAYAPFPPPGATNVGRIVDLSWEAGAEATAHDVYFGTTNPPPYVGTQGGTVYDPGALARDQLYYWRIDEVNPYGTTTGTVWSFIPGRNVGRR